MEQNLENMGFTVVPFGQGIKIQKVIMIVEVFCLCRISFRKVPV